MRKTIIFGLLLAVAGCPNDDAPASGGATGIGTGSTSAGPTATSQSSHSGGGESTSTTSDGSASLGHTTAATSGTSTSTGSTGTGSTGDGDVCGDPCVTACWYGCGCDEWRDWYCFGKCVKHCGD